MNNERLLQEIESLKQENDIFKQENDIIKKKIINLEKANRERRGPFSKINLFFGVFISALITSMVLYAAQITFTEGTVISASEMNSNFTELYTMVNNLKNIFDGVSRDGNNIVFSGVNVQIVNGSGITSSTNELGNLIVGYNEPRLSAPNDRTGSHNVIIGEQHNFSSYGGIVTGLGNTIIGKYSSITGGAYGKVEGDYSSVSGGYGSWAIGDYSSVSSGFFNKSNGNFSNVSGGCYRTSDDPFSWRGASFYDADMLPN